MLEQEPTERLSTVVMIGGRRRNLRRQCQVARPGPAKTPIVGSLPRRGPAEARRSGRVASHRRRLREELAPLWPRVTPEEGQPSVVFRGRPGRGDRGEGAASPGILQDATGGRSGSSRER